MSKVKKRDRSEPPQKIWCVVKALSSGKYSICLSNELHHVSSDQRYWPFCPQNDQDFDLKAEYGAIQTIVKTQRMVMHNILFMSCDEEEAIKTVESGRLPNGSRLPNPKRRQTLTPMEFNLEELSFVNAVKSANDRKKTSVKAKAASKQSQNDSILKQYVNQQRGSYSQKTGDANHKQTKELSHPSSLQKSSKNTSIDNGSQSKKTGDANHEQTKELSHPSSLQKSSKNTSIDNGSQSSESELQKQLHRLLQENEALKLKLNEEESTKTAFMQLTQEVGKLKKTVEHGAVSSAQASNLANFVTEGSNPPEIEFSPYKSITLKNLQYIERNVFKFTAKVNKICDNLWGADEVHLYYVRGPKTSDDDDIRVIDPIIFERMSDIIGVMKVLKSEREIDTSEAAVKCQVEKYTSYKRRQNALLNLPEEEKKNMKAEVMTKKKESLQRRKGQKLFVINKRKRVYLRKGDDSSDDGSVISQPDKTKKRARANISSDSEQDQQQDDGQQSGSDSASESAHNKTSPPPLQASHKNLAESELLFSELDTPPEAKLRQLRERLHIGGLVPNYASNDGDGNDSDVTMYSQHDDKDDRDGEDDGDGEDNRY